MKNGTEGNGFNKIIIGFLTVMLLISSIPIFSFASEEGNDTRQQIMVSMGDSYSSGEGIEKFYGQDEAMSKKVNNPDWLAHRSEKAWSGMLALPTVDGVMSENRNENWFFVAASGATTQNIRYNFIKEYDKNGYKGSYYLEPQLKVFDKLGQNKADYVTLTLGGNDVDFVGTISQCVTKNSHLQPNHLTDKLNNTWKDFFADGGVRDKLYDTYSSIAEKAGEQARIIVAGYPLLLESSHSVAGGFIGDKLKDGDWLSFSEREITELNDAVHKFNRAIESIVLTCKGNGMNIYFVSVEDEFDGHAAYSSDPYINNVIIGSQSEDLQKFMIASAYSIHPNEKGARAYARCVQAKIDELENVQSAGYYNTKFTLTVYDVNDYIYGNYTIEINGEEFVGPFKLGLFKKEYTKTISVDEARKVKINLPKGNYSITVADGSDKNRFYKKDVKIRPNNKKDELIFRTDFGQILSKEEQNQLPGVGKTSGERNIVLTLDTSGSMSGTPMEETKKASTNFINTVLEQDASIGIVTYDNMPNIASGFSADRVDLQSIVSELYSAGETNIEAGLKDAQWMLEKTNSKKKIIVLMSDGEPNRGLVNEDLIDYANEIKKSGTIIYTIGFFESLSEKSYAQYLMESIASEGYHYEVANANELAFFFEDMADQINGQKYIYVRIACPVDVSVVFDGETLDSSEENLNTRTSFGTLSFEENREKMTSDSDDRVKVLRLKEGADYDLKLTGTGHGIMNYTIGFTDENGDYSDLRKFENVKITRRTRIDTVASNSDNIILNIDEDGDGKYDIKLRAEANGYGEEVATFDGIIYIIIGAVVFIMLVIVAIVLYTKSRKKKGE